MLFGLFFFQAEDGIRDRDVTGVQTCALPIFPADLSTFLVDYYRQKGVVMRLGEGVAGLDQRGGKSVLRTTSGGELTARSEERRVGKECRSGGWGERVKKREGVVTVGCMCGSG